MDDGEKRSRVIRAQLDPEVIARIDALALVLARDGVPATRAQILRRLVVLGLAAEEKALRPPRSSRRRARRPQS
jgi:hypothetical protein